MTLLYQKFAKPLLRFLIKRYNLDEDTAAELAQEAWLAAFKSYKTFNNKSTFFTWLCKIAIFKSADYYRKYINKNSGFIAPTLDDVNNLISPDITPEEYATLVDMRDKVKKCLMLLPEKYQQILLLRYYNQYSYKQIAEEMHLSLRTVEHTLEKAKKKFVPLYLNLEHK